MTLSNMPQEGGSELTSVVAETQGGPNFLNSLRGKYMGALLGAAALMSVACSGCPDLRKDGDIDTGDTGEEFEKPAQKPVRSGERRGVKINPSEAEIQRYRLATAQIEDALNTFVEMDVNYNKSNVKNLRDAADAALNLIQFMEKYPEMRDPNYSYANLATKAAHALQLADRREAELTAAEAAGGTPAAGAEAPALPVAPVIAPEDPVSARDARKARRAEKRNSR
ncbi:hypothetical protein KKC94_04330 [Patescibacteria group bacterium]|nr:hypothetical protein [Patescibacteria group bacterium]